MDFNILRGELTPHRAIVVHRSRPSRDGEFGKSRPLYPDDLKQTIRDLDIGGVRPVSCPVVWVAHQDTFGDVGVIVVPRPQQIVLIFDEG